MRLKSRTELTGPLQGRVEIVYEEDGRELSFITAIGSASDVAGQPVAEAHRGRRYATHVEEMNRRRHFVTDETAHVCQELHDPTGAVERAWKERGGKYAHTRNARGNLVAGPVILRDADYREYVKVHNAIAPRGRQLHEA